MKDEREKPPSHLTSCNAQPRHIPQKGTGYFPKLRHILAGTGCGPGTPGQLGRAGCPGEPRMGLTPRLGQDTQSLAEAQTRSVYRICQPGSPPPPITSPGVLGAGRGQAGPVGVLAACLPNQARIYICLQHPFFWRPSLKPGQALPTLGQVHFKGILEKQRLPPTEAELRGAKIGSVPSGAREIPKGFLEFSREDENEAFCFPHTPNPWAPRGICRIPGGTWRKLARRTDSELSGLQSPETRIPGEPSR